MGHGHFSASIQAAGVRRAARPWGVTLVAAFQALKAAILLITGLMLHFRPDDVLEQQGALYPILYIAMRGNASLVKTAMNGGNALSAIMLVFGLYLAYLASGLWQMRPLARRAVMFTSGMTLVLYVKSVLLSSVHDGSLSGAGFFAPDLHNVHLLLFLDTAIFVYLMRGSTAKQFIA